ncbi:hypothetical protein [Parasphingorhabdus cellanae]|uniref:Uncharacterized protein n=1 Tax=Parasphingorhabdus cellanae TaxID=2806553 RepID=A0ABX7T8G7_9SPHN|nr:hypothetical protein [Parasphingorhabdus cellanae]QTD56233.1 hypothetical protein J4G78_01095 [Parasphingorhabdus cellanae]
MHARKIRYDDTFIADEDQKNVADTIKVTSTDSLPVDYVPSPARQLQQQLKEQFDDTVAVEKIEKYSGLSSISIIVGSCLALWTGIISLGLWIFQ